MYVVLFVIVGTTAPNCFAFAQNMVFAFDPTNPNQDVRLLKFIAFVTITFICTLHIFSRRMGIAINNVTGSQSYLFSSGTLG